MEKQPNISSGLNPEQRAAKIAELKKFLEESEEARKREEEIAGLARYSNPDISDARRKLAELLKEEKHEKDN